VSRKTLTPEERFFQQVGKLVENNDWEAIKEESEAYLQIDEECDEAYFLMALSAFGEDDYASAVTYARAAVDIAPTVLEYVDLLAVIYGTAGDLNNATFYAKLGSVNSSAKHVKAWIPPSIPQFTEAFFETRQRPFFQNGLAAAARGAWVESEHWFRQHLVFQPRDADAFVGLANAMMIQGLYVPSVEILRAARHALPNDARIGQLLGSSLAALGQFAEGRSIDRWAMAESPDDAVIHASAYSNLLMNPDATALSLVAGAQEWGRRFGVSPDEAMPPRVPSSKRRLTVGYLVGAMDRSSQARGLADILAQHDSNKFRIIGFGSGQLSDSFNIVFQKCFESWLDTRDTDPLTFGSLVAAEDVDILVDVSGWATPTLMTGFGARMAPLQVTWNGCPYGTGLANMDALLTDAVLDPEDGDTFPYVEKPIRLKNGCTITELPLPSTDVAEAPDKGDGPVLAADVTLAEADPETVEIWAAILRAVPEASLILYDRGFHNATALPKLIGSFGNHGMAHRVDIISSIELAEFFGYADVFLMPRESARIDVAVRALSAGLPVVCLNGDAKHRQLIGSLLHYAGLDDDLVADTPAAYIDKAIRWAEDASARETFAETINERLASAPVFDASARVADLESAYLELWQSICPDEASEKQDV
jgi:protein O-GlcNAc transferase